MAELLPVPEKASDKDRQRIEQVNRNLKIREQYPRLREEHGWQRAQSVLADRHHCSTHTIQKVLEERR